MGFFGSAKDDNRRDKNAAPSVELLHKMQCKVCPLDKQTGIRHPHMEPSGTRKPLIYMLGESPSYDDDYNDDHYSDTVGNFLRRQIPEEFERKLRWNNIIRTFPKGERSGDRGVPTPISIECCRPSVQADIELTKPKAIFGFGHFPLRWVLNRSGITDWRGRRLPVKVGSHVCWYYPMLDPKLVMEEGGESKELVFKLDLQRAFSEINYIPEAVVHSTADAELGVRWLEGQSGDLETVKKFLKRVAAIGECGLDYETNGLRPYRKEMRVMTAAVSVGDSTLAFPFDHPGAKWTTRERRELNDVWIEFLLEPKVLKVSHNAAFELEWSGVKFDCETIRSDWADTMSEAAILDERVGCNKPGCLSLDFLCTQYFGLGIKALSSVNVTRIANEPLVPVLRYNGIDAKYHYLLHLAQHELLVKEGLLPVYTAHYKRIPTVVLTQIKGLPVSQPVVKELAAKYSGRILEIERKISEEPVARQFLDEYQRQFNPASNPDCLALFGKLLGRTEITKYDKKERRERDSVDEEVLLQIDHPMAKLVLDCRHARKCYSTYVEPLQEGSPLIYEDGLLHPIINTVFAETGRTTSEDPNEQNFPKRDGESREVRGQIKAPEGFILVAADYGQIQVRNIAMESGDEALCKALWERHDFHMDWTQKLAKAYPERVGGKKNLTDKAIMKKFRTDVKNQWSFPLFFGCSSRSAAGYLKIPEKHILPLYDEFWATFPGVKAWQDKLLESYKRKGYVENMTGRRRHAPLSKNQIINSPIQADEADIVLSAMERLSALGDPHLQAILNIHDDLTFLLPIDGVETYVETIVDHMLSPPFNFITVPITVEVSIGPDWCNLKELADFHSDRWGK